MIMYNKTIPERLVEARKYKRCSVSKLADLSGVSRNTLVNIEHGHFGGTIDTLELVAAALGLRIDIIDKTTGKKF